MKKAVQRRVVAFVLAVVALAGVCLGAAPTRERDGYQAACSSKTLSLSTDFPDHKKYPTSRMLTLSGGTMIQCNPNEFGSKGGVLLRSTGVCRGATEIRLSFEVWFVSKGGVPFDFGRGGKLGLGVQFGSGDIQGGNWLPTAASARVMWREHGAPHAYVYYGKRSSPSDLSDQAADYKTIASPSSDTTGHDLWREGKKGTPLPRFKNATWNPVSLYCRMNSGPFRQDGVLQLSVNGQTRSYNKMRWLDSPTGVDSVQFSTWYGGSDATWAPKTPQLFIYKNLRVTQR